MLEQDQAKIVSSGTLVASGTGFVLAAIGLVAFNFGYLGLYGAFLPLLCIGLLLFVEVGEDVFLSLPFLAVASTLIYVVGLFALPLIMASILLTAPIVMGLQRWGVVSVPVRRVFDFAAIFLVALSARYVLYRSGGGQIPLQIGGLETLSRFLISEVAGWGVFALGYRVQHHLRYSPQFSASVDFAVSLPSLLVTGLFLVSPHVAIMIIGLNTFGIVGLYVGLLPVGAAHVLVRTLTMRRGEIEWQNVRLQQMNLDLARNERLAAIGQMSSAISHQMLQKVGLLGLQCDVLRETLQEEGASPLALLHEVQERVEQFDGTLTDLNQTLADLLVFSRDFVLNLEPCSLDQLINETVEEMRAAAAAQQVTLRYHCENHVTRLAVDRIKLKQALLNLLKNAIEASPVMGEVLVILGTDGQKVYTTIRDHGHGVAKEDIPRLFSPFFSTKEKGTGLGLTFAQKIIELHHGRILVSNNSDGGATFRVELPLQQDEESKWD
jgi:signal transduction histidine kinase